jgi:predicted DNA-binding transcriptional regulator AlpA
MQVLSKKRAAAKAGFVERTLERLIERGQGPPTVQLSARRVGIIDIDLEAWLLKRRRLPPGWTAEKAAPQFTASEDPAGHAEVDAGEGDAKRHRSKATPSRAASASGRKVRYGTAKADAEAPA